MKISGIIYFHRILQNLPRSERKMYYAQEFTADSFFLRIFLSITPLTLVFHLANYYRFAGIASLYDVTSNFHLILTGLFLFNLFSVFYLSRLQNYSFVFTVFITYAFTFFVFYYSVFNPQLEVSYVMILYAFILMLQAFRLQIVTLVVLFVVILFFSVYSNIYYFHYSFSEYLAHAVTYLFSTLIGLVIIYFRRETFIDSLNLHKEQKLINNDLRIAKIVQEALFPKKHEFPHFKYEVYRRAYNQIGGDFYDFIQLREGNVGIFFTDVAGHGISAALVASILKVIVATIPYQLKLKPYQFMNFIDAILNKDLNSYHASAIYIFLDFIKKEILLSNGGHPYVILSQQRGKFTQLETVGSLLGFGMEQAEKDMVSLKMASGDRYFLYTDGFIESVNSSGKSLGEDGLLDILNRYHREENLEVLKNSIMADLTSFLGDREYNDDVMLLLFEIK